MHQLGVWHADLNVYNILFDDQAKVWLIDFDRSRLMAFLTPAQRAQNLSRLLRSLKKLSLTHERECWLALSDAYQEHWRAFEILE
jgi:3-deoxy-D-manno-octulosonic acid kinase